MKYMAFCRGLNWDCTASLKKYNEIYLLIKYIKCVLWRVAERLSHIEDAWCLKVRACLLLYVSLVLWYKYFDFFFPTACICIGSLFYLYTVATTCRHVDRIYVIRSAYRPRVQQSGGRRWQRTLLVRLTRLTASISLHSIGRLVFRHFRRTAKRDC